jgi:hypothetical protein
MMLRADVALVPLDDELVAFSEEMQRLIGLNSSAAFVARRLQANVPVSLIEAELVAEGMATATQATDWVAETVSALGSQGLLDGWQGVSGMIAPSQEQRDERVVQMPPLTPFEPTTERRYKLLNTTALIRYSLPRQVEWVEAVIGHLAHEQNALEPTIVIDIQNVPRTGDMFGAHIYRNGHAAAVASRLVALGPAVKGLLWQSAINESNLSFYFHAGVVATGESCILLPGSSGSGKSSLTLALTDKGFRYFSDEVALLEPETFRVLPVPLAICVKRSGWDVIARYRPDIWKQIVHVRSDGKHVRYLRPPLQRASAMLR